MWSSAPIAVLAVLAVAPAAASEAGSTFHRFVGEWIGTGHVVGSDGLREPIRCRSQNGQPDRAALDLAILCASDSYRIDIRSHVEASADEVRGTWSENTRGVSGTLQGRLTSYGIEGRIEGGPLTAALSLTARGGAERIDIRTQGADVAEVTVEMRRR